MSFKSTIRVVRPDTDIEFAGFTPEQKRHVNDVYIKTGKLQTTTTESFDGMTITIERTFTTEQDFEDYRADPVIQEAVANILAAHEANGHVPQVD